MLKQKIFWCAASTHKGEEITNLLVHLIDSSQNSKFRDKYFHDIESRIPYTEISNIEKY